MFSFQSGLPVVFSECKLQRVGKMDSVMGTKIIVLLLLAIIKVR